MAKLLSDYIDNPNIDEGYVTTKLKKFTVERMAERMPDIMDGLIHPQRAVLYTVQRPSYDKKTVVSMTAPHTKTLTSYQHGDQNLIDVVKNMVQKPHSVIEGYGTFRTKTDPTGGAARYIEIKRNKASFAKLFPRIENDVLLSHRTGTNQTELEPISYTPTIPTLLLWGNRQIAVGYSASVYPRKYEDIVDRIKLLNNDPTNPKTKDRLPIHVEGFIGTIEQSGNKDKARQWTSKGIYKRVNNLITITEVPVYTNFERYMEKIVALKKAGVITAYFNGSQGDNIHVECTLSSVMRTRFDDMAHSGNAEQLEIEKLFGLSANISDVIICMDEEAKDLYQFDDETSYMNFWFKRKQLSMRKRIDYQIAFHADQANKLRSMVAVIYMQNSDLIRITDYKDEKELAVALDNTIVNDTTMTTSSKLYTHLQSKSIFNLIDDKLYKAQTKVPYDYIFNIKTIQMTKTHITKLLAKLTEQETLLAYYQGTTVQVELNLDLDKL